MMPLPNRLRMEPPCPSVTSVKRYSQGGGEPLCGVNPRVGRARPTVLIWCGDISVPTSSHLEV